MQRKPLASLLRRHLHFPTKSTMPKLARQIGIDVRTLHGLILEGEQPNRHTLKKLAVFLNMPLVELRRRPGFRAKARRLTMSSERAKLLNATLLENKELDRIAVSGRAHGLATAPASIEALAERIERNLEIVFDGRRDVRAVITTAEQAEATMRFFLGNLPSLPPLLVYIPLRITHARYGRRGTEALQAIVLGIINSGWSCILLASPFTLTSDVFACWPDVACLPPADTCSMIFDPLEYIYAHLGSDSARHGQPVDATRDALRLIVERMTASMVTASASVRNPHNEVDSANLEKARIVSATLQRMASKYIGCDQDIGIINLHFRGVRDCQENLNALLLYSHFFS